jgi:anti-sigma B factor antagonist
MPEPQARLVGCPVVVLSLRDAQINNDAVAEDLRDELLALYLQVGAVNVILDFQAVTYLSSAGFRPLLSLNRHVRERGGRLVLCNMRPEVEEVFVVTRLIDPTGAGPAAFLAQPTIASAVIQVCQPGEPPATGPATSLLP